MLRIAILVSSDRFYCRIDLDATNAHSQMLVSFAPADPKWTDFDHSWDDGADQLLN
jgi:hypothetical protein